ncbi:hypothetical protein ACLMJK_004047 [Lecanora helva]
MVLQESARNSSLVTKLNAIWESTEYSDLTIRCGSEDFKVHRAVVCVSCPFFAKACAGQWQEAQTGVIDLEEDDCPTVGRMLKYMYIEDYEDEGDAASITPYLRDTPEIYLTEADKPRNPNEPFAGDNTSTLSRHLNNVAVYAIAEKYSILRLKDLALDKFESLMCKQELSPAIPTVIDAIFRTTTPLDEELRGVAVKFCASYDAEIVSDERYSWILRNHGDLGLGVLRKLGKERKEDRNRTLTRLEDILHFEIFSGRARRNYSDTQQDSIQSLASQLRELKNSLKTPK